jgi:hypothetical protein
MDRMRVLEQKNRRCARLRWGSLGHELMEQLKFLTRRFGLLVAQNEVQLLNLMGPRFFDPKSELVFGKI